jgi:hypothetical protein
MDPPTCRSSTIAVYTKFRMGVKHRNTSRQKATRLSPVSQSLRGEELMRCTE